MVLTDGPACKIDCFPLLNSKYSQLTKTKAHNQKTEFEFAVKDNFWGILKKHFISSTAMHNDKKGQSLIG